MSMRILFDQGVYDLRNTGNVAMLQVAVRRLSQRWPDADLKVITSAPHLLRLYCPGARPVSPQNGSDWLNRGSALDSLTSRLPVGTLRFLLEGREVVRRRWPRLGQMLTRPGLASLSAVGAQNGHEQTLNGNTAPTEVQAGATYDGGRQTATIEGVDLFIATGSQYMSDVCRDDAMQVLDRLEAAHLGGSVTAMVGQGLGPFEDQELRQRVKRVLPLVDLILVRDKRAGMSLLDSLGVDPSRVVFTGDDAIEMAYEARTPARGNRIGVGLRVAYYTAVTDDHLGTLRPILQRAAALHQTELVPLPISHSLHEVDDRALGQLLNGHKPTGLGRSLDPPIALIHKVAQCRVVVTGAFHPAVFALSQGIPVVGLALSAMYVEKFMSLVDQFGAGCQVVRLDEEHLDEKLGAAIDTAWRSAEGLRPQLLEVAGDQVQLGHAGYSRLYELVESNCRV